MSIMGFAFVTDPDFVRITHEHEIQKFVVVHLHNLEENVECYGPYGYVTYETYKGLCLVDYEHNGYDDSDFYMVVWNVEKHIPEKICFASTRGWSPVFVVSGSYVDAPEEIREAYVKYVYDKDVALRFENKRIHNERLTKIAEKNNLTLESVERLFNATFPNFEPFEKLLMANLRSAFRKSLREQVVKWLLDPAPKHMTPLSRKQLEYL
jgi:hypothetical protein